MQKDDVIYRQAAIDMLKNRWKKTRNYEGIGDDIAEECELYLKQVPSAQPEERTKKRTETHTCDCISRSAVYDRVSRIVSVNHLDPEKVWFTPIGVKALIKEMPPAQPEEAIPVAWIEAKITRLIAMDNEFAGLTAHVIKTLLNEWRIEKNETD